MIDMIIRIAGDEWTGVSLTSLPAATVARVKTVRARSAVTKLGHVKFSVPHISKWNVTPRDAQVNAICAFVEDLLDSE